MATRKSNQHFEFESITLLPSSQGSQFRQIENQIRSAITTGRLPGGARVPSSRRLAELLQISRNTVLSAYEQLISEGYLESQVGSGTRVSLRLPSSFEFPRTTRSASSSAKDIRRLSSTGRRLLEFSQHLPNLSPHPQPFRPHRPAVREFPIKVWNRFLNEFSRFSVAQMSECDPQGYEPLREAIAEYMAISRGVACTSKQIVVTAGAQQGLSLLTQILLEPGETIWVEEPGNAPASQLLQLSGYSIAGIPVDAEGIDLKQAPSGTSCPGLIYVTPGGQWPMAMTMSLNRRMQLLDDANRLGCWIVEDDYNGEFRYTGRPHPALCSLDSHHRTIYLGSFSKLLFPAIRLGFLVVPEPIAPAFRCGRWLADRYSPPLTQMVLHRFIESGQFLKHIRRMRPLYQERQRTLFDALTKAFGDDIEVSLPESGMHLVVQGKTSDIDRRLMEAAERAGIEFHPVSLYSQSPGKARGLILGFAAFDPAEIKRAVVQWARGVKRNRGT